MKDHQESPSPSRVPWPTKPLSDCIENVKVPNKIQRNSFRQTGKFPIISQEVDFINGYWDDEAAAIKVSGPVVIFGDHTQVLKLVGFDFVVGADGVKILKPKAFLDAAFLRYFLQAHPVPSMGYARHYRHISGLDVPLPPLEEQQRIVAVLDQAFTDLDRVQTYVDANLVDVDALFEVGLEHVIEQHSRAGVQTRLGNVCLFENGDRGKNYPGRKAFVPEGVPFINAGHIDNGTIDWDEMNFIPEGHYHRLSNGKVKEGDLLFCLRGSLGKFGKVDRGGFGAIASSLVIVRAGDSILPDYLGMYFRSEMCRRMIENYAGGAAQPNLAAGDLKRFEIRLPRLPEQTLAVEAHDQLRESTRSLRSGYERRLANIADLRRSLLQLAFSGRLA